MNLFELLLLLLLQVPQRGADYRLLKQVFVDLKMGFLSN